MKQFFKGIFLVLGIIYILGCTALYFLQDSFLFRPSPLDENTHFRFGEEVSINVAPGIDLHALYHQSDKPKGAFLYLHGNRGNTRWCQRQAETFAAAGYDVLLLDYRGYGKSEGHIYSSKQLYGDVQKAYDFLKKRYDEERISVAGYSLGTGMASYLAANNHPAHLILVAPYVSIADMKNRYFPLIPNFLIKYPLNNKAHLKKINCPVAIFHGTDDQVIPSDSSEDLKKLFPDKVELHLAEEVSHRGIIFHRDLSRYLKGL